MELSYTMVAEARGQRVLWFRMFGSYQGEWLLLSRDEDLYYLWRDSYGSCSGCDALQGHFDYSGDDLTPESPKVQEFIANYSPFLEMRPEAALGIAEREENLLAVLPRNRREWYDRDWDNVAVGYQLALIVKKEEGAISAAEILELDNQEIRREAIERFGAERFISDLDPRFIDQEGGDVLYRLPPTTHSQGADFAFLYLQDPSTERRYVLRVDPSHETVRAARAASFGIPEDRFMLAQET